MGIDGTIARDPGLENEWGRFEKWFFLNHVFSMIFEVFETSIRVFENMGIISNNESIPFMLI